MFDLSRPWVLDLLSTGGGRHEHDYDHVGLKEHLVEIGSVEGFSVEAQDGSIGEIDESTIEVGGSYVVVDTGPWIFGKKVLLPAGMIERVDRTDERVFVALTKEQIKNAPEFDDVTYRDDEYRSSLGDYYAPSTLGNGARRRSRHIGGSSATVLPSSRQFVDQPRP